MLLPLKIWRILETFFIKVTLPPNVTLGQNCRIFKKPRIYTVKEACIEIGEGVVLNSLPQGYHAGMGFPVTLICDRPKAMIKIGDHSRLHGCCIHAWSGIVIGRKCLFAAGSQVLDANGHATELKYARLRTKLRDQPSSIRIGDFCWIGLGALVLKGVNLGEGCIVAAHSVVTAGDYPPFSLLAGMPAKVIRRLDKDEVLPEDYDIGNLAFNRITDV